MVPIAPSFGCTSLQFMYRDLSISLPQYRILQRTMVELLALKNRNYRMASVINISGYKFVRIYDTKALRVALRERLGALGLKGSIVLSPEGVNVMLAGDRDQIEGYYKLMQQDSRFADMVFKESPSQSQPFQRLTLKCKQHIVPADYQVDPAQRTGEYIEPQTLKAWLDEGREVVLLDTRNDYEIEHGTFVGAKDFHLKQFSEFSHKAQQAQEMKDKTVVMFCTGGIRCEKASVLALDAGFKEVYQLDGGILKYFETCGDAHYQGDCFVFDERVAVKPDLSVKS